MREKGWESPGPLPEGHDQGRAGGRQAGTGQGPSLSPTLTHASSIALARAGSKVTEISETSPCSVSKGPAKGHLDIACL